MIHLKVLIRSVQKELRRDRVAVGGFLATDGFLRECTARATSWHKHAFSLPRKGLTRKPRASPWLLAAEETARVLIRGR